MQTKKNVLTKQWQMMRRSCGNVRQVLSIKWTAFRAWQESPIEYKMDGSAHVCNNCGYRYRGNYCPRCSQSAHHGRISWLAMWQGIGQLWGIESRSAIYTLWQLLWRPGYLVRDYISGKRQVSYPPVKLLFILAAVVALIQFFFPRPATDISEIGYQYVDYALRWLDEHQSISALANGCIFILPTWILFRNAPLYPNHSIPEGFFLQVYIAILTFLLSSFFAEGALASTVLIVLYTFATYKQLFGYGYWGTFWRLLICFALSLVILVIFIIIGIAISKLHIFTNTQ